MGQVKPAMIVKGAWIFMLDATSVQADIWVVRESYYFWLNGQVHTVQHGAGVTWVETGCVDLFVNQGK